MNLGATNVYDAGTKMQWQYNYYLGTSSPDDEDYYCTYSKYVDDFRFGKNNNEGDHKYSLDLEDDEASKAWNGLWSTPTDAQLYELNAYCNWTIVTNGTKKLAKATSTQNGAEILFPLEWDNINNEGKYYLRIWGNKIGSSGFGTCEGTTNTYDMTIWTLKIESSDGNTVSATPSGYATLREQYSHIRPVVKQP